MTQLTRDVVVDLWPLYASGEASPDTRALVESFIKDDREFGERLRRQENEGLVSSEVTLPADHERATLLRIQKRRARQSMVVNALALLVSGALTAFYIWDIVPRWAITFAAAGVPLPAGMRVATNASAWALRLGLPLLLLIVPLAIGLRKRLRVPTFLESGIALAVVTGIAVVAAQIGWLTLLNEASIALQGAYQSLAAAPR